MKAKYFIWDFDGTIIDTYPRSTQILIDTMREIGVELDYDKFIEMLRDSFGKTKKYLNMSDELFDLYLKRACTLSEPHPTPYDDIEEILSTVCKSGGKNFLYTHRDTSAIEYLKMYDLEKYFSECVTSECENFSFKPAPNVIEGMIKRHGLDKDKTVMIGDREIDVLSGKNAGCKAILFDERRIYTETSADKKIYELCEILNFIEK